MVELRRYFFFLKMAKIWVGRTPLNGETNAWSNNFFVIYLFFSLQHIPIALIKSFLGIQTFF